MAETDSPATREPTVEPVASAAPTPEPERGAVVVKRRSPLWPVLGGAVAAVIGYGVAQVVPNGWPLGTTQDLTAQLADQAAQVKALQGQVQDLTQRLQAASSLVDRVGKLEASPAGNADQIAKLEARVAGLEARPSAGDPAAIAALRSDVEMLKASGAGVVSPELQASLDAKVKETEAKLAEVEKAAQASSEAALARAAVRQIVAALESGAPYATALGDLKGSVPAVLKDHAQTGLPTLQALQADFPDAARAALEAALRANMGQSWSERVANFLRAQTGARALSPREGNDPDAVLSRAEAATAKGDLSGALVEIAKLPPEGVAAMADWQARAQVRLDALAAVQALGG